MSFELFYFDGCPSWELALKNLTQVLTEHGISDKVEVVQVLDETEAKEFKFPGSPTIRFDGMDLWPVQQAEYHLDCRLYRTPQGLKGSPTLEMLRHRLQELNL